MKKILTILTFSIGAIFGMLFSTKKGEEIRKEVKAKKTSDEKMEIVGEEAKAMLRNFWKTVKGPVEKHLKTLKDEAEKYGKKYGKGALEGLEREARMVKNTVKKGVKKAQKSVQKTVHVVRKKLK